jgi:hypothetical protein
MILNYTINKETLFERKDCYNQLERSMDGQEINNLNG